MRASGSRTHVPIPRRSHKKSKTGCRTCRDRKIKCDERRPLCVNCERRWDNIIACDFDGHERIFNPNAGAAASADHSRRALPSRLPPTQRRLQPTSSETPQTTKVGREAETLPLPPTVGAGRIDPFEARPASQQAASTVDALMGHYLSDFAYRSFPFYASKSLIEIWWPFVRSDDVLFHVILLLSSLDREHLQNQREFHSIHTTKLLGECLTLLNERVRDPVAGINNQTLVSIAALVAMESGRENMRARDMHLEGLKRVVDLRGGLDLIREENAMTANFVFWCAMVAINEPKEILPLSYGDEFTGVEWLHNLETTALLTHDGGQTELTDFGVDFETANILTAVQRMSKLYTAKLQYDTPLQAVAVLSNLCSILETLLRLSKSSPNNSKVPGLSQSCRLAACLHLFTPVSGYFPDPTLMLHTLVRDLKGSLTHTIGATGHRSHLLLWLLSVGGISAHSIPERAWFVGHLVVVVGDLQIDSWDVMRQNLVALAFHDNFCDMSFHALWVEVRKKQEELHGGPRDFEAQI